MTEAQLYSVYKGVYVPKAAYPPEALKYYEEFTFRKDDVLIVTYPRSGEWLSQVMFQVDDYIFLCLLKTNCRWMIFQMIGFLAEVLLWKQFEGFVVLFEEGFKYKCMHVFPFKDIFANSAQEMFESFYSQKA